MRRKWIAAIETILMAISCSALFPGSRTEAAMQAAVSGTRVDDVPRIKLYGTTPNVVAGKETELDPTEPTLDLYIPQADKATGAGVLILLCDSWLDIIGFPKPRSAEAGASSVTSAPLSNGWVEPRHLEAIPSMIAESCANGPDRKATKRPAFIFVNAGLRASQPKNLKGETQLPLERAGPGLRISQISEVTV